MVNKQLHKIHKDVDIREKKRVAKQLFDDFSLTLLALGFLAVIFLYFEAVFATLVEYESLYAYIGLFAAIICSIFVLINYFGNKNKTEKTMHYYLLVGIFVNGSFGLLTMIEILKDTQGYMIIFPIINSFSALYLIHMLKLKKVNEYSIIQTKKNITKFLVCATILLVAILLSKYVWHQKWFYTMSVVLAITSFFGIKKR